MKLRTDILTIAMLGLLPVLACALTATPLAAQGVPALAVGLDAGGGPHTERAGDTYYRDVRGATLRLTGQFRAASLKRVAPVVRVEAAYDGPGDQLDDCPFAPNGTCRKYPPGNSGWAFGAGLAFAPVRFVEASVVAGRGRYDRTGRSFLQAQLALSPLRHLALTASLTHMTWKEANGYPHWFRPVHLGFRLQ